METLNGESNKDRISRWQETELSDLASQFNKLVNNQYQRAFEFGLLGSELNNFKNLKISKLKLSMGLSKPDEEGEKGISCFQPVLEINYDERDNEKTGNQPSSFVMQDVGIVPTNPKNEKMSSEPVPRNYVENAKRNWSICKPETLSDLFICTTENGLQRVHSFIITGAGLEIFQKHASQLKELNLYLGVDPGKAAYEQCILFTPIFGLKFEELPSLATITSKSCHGISWNSEGVENEIFVEYSTPCPPTCH